MMLSESSGLPVDENGKALDLSFPEKSKVRVEGHRCPYCHDTVTRGEGESYFCDQCFAVSHRECVDFHGSCSGCVLGGVPLVTKDYWVAKAVEENLFVEELRSEMEKSAIRGWQKLTVMAFFFCLVAGIFFAKTAATNDIKPSFTLFFLLLAVLLAVSLAGLRRVKREISEENRNDSSEVFWTVPELLTVFWLIISVVGAIASFVIELISHF